METTVTQIGGTRSAGGRFVQGVRFGNQLPMVLIAGPCQIESMEHTLHMASSLKGICDALGIRFVFKASYLKANRTNVESKTGVGLKRGLTILEEVRRLVGVPVTTDVHTVEEAKAAALYVDLLQIPAMASRDTRLINTAAYVAEAVSIKKGQGMAPSEMEYAAKKAHHPTAQRPILIERGTTFGYGRLVNDMRGLEVMKQWGPVVFDATHSVQLPAGMGGSSGGERVFVEPLARAAVAVGIAGVFLECHEDPNNAPSDGPCMVHLSDMPALLNRLKRIDSVVKAF